jgi:nucleoside-diphosphate-sugar epimerase
MSQRVVVTGGAGFVGSNIVKELLARGDSVTVIDDLSTGKYDNIAHLVEDGEVEFFKGSILDMDLLRIAFKDADFVLHQAAMSSSQVSLEDPLSTYEVNVTGTFNVLLTARDSGIKKVVLASSSSVYGDAVALPVAEDMKADPQTPYATSKLMCELYAESFTNIFNLPVACMRYFSVYGPFQNSYSNYADIVPSLITSIGMNKSPIIYGDGMQMGDFTYVQDAVDATLLAMRSSATGVFNVAYGAKISINDLAEIIMDIVGNHPSPVYVESRKGDSKDFLADVSKARNGFGFEPTYDLDEGLEATVNWQLEQVRQVPPLYNRHIVGPHHRTKSSQRHPKISALVPSS